MRLMTCHNLKFALYLLIIFLTGAASLKAQTEITGFFDIIHTYRLSSQETGGFRINQFEIDISKAYKGNLSFGAAIAYDSTSHNIGLSMVYLHYNFINPSVKHPRRSEEDEHIGLVLGKFDVPIGLDYLSYASPDRPVVTQPLIIEKTIAGWNDVGINFHINNRLIRVNLSLINGFNNGLNLAGDFVFKLRPGFQLGLFHTSDFDRKIYRKSRMTGLSILGNYQILQLKSELIWANGIYGGEQDTLGESHAHSGYYVQLVSDLGKLKKKTYPLFFTMRLSVWKDKNQNSPVYLPSRIERYVLGIGYRINQYSSFRLEYLRQKSQGIHYSDRFTGQMVVSF